MSKQKQIDILYDLNNRRLSDIDKLNKKLDLLFDYLGVEVITEKTVETRCNIFGDEKEYIIRTDKIVKKTNKK